MNLCSCLHVLIDKAHGSQITSTFLCVAFSSCRSELKHQRCYIQDVNKRNVVKQTLDCSIRVIIPLMAWMDLVGELYNTGAVYLHIIYNVTSTHRLLALLSLPT